MPSTPTIQYCSDLHLEFGQNKAYLRANPLLPCADILVLAGDIVPFAVRKEHDDFFRFAAKNFKYTYWLPGNHEYYGADIAAKSGSLMEKIKPNVFLVNNVSVVLNSIRLVFSTLWGTISAANDWMIEKSVSDFTAIRYSNYRFSAPVFNQLHQDSMTFLTSELAIRKDEDLIVVTHHVPTFFNYPTKYKGSTLNEAFGIELFDFIEGSGANYWIYGHHHVNTPDFAIGDTKLLTNQLGYVQQGEHLLFDNAKTIAPGC